jgi:hypothetical protein
MSDTAEPTDNRPEVQHAIAALNAQMEQLYGPLPQVEIPNSRKIDINAFRLDASEAARPDIETEQRSRQYAAAVTQAWADKSAAATTAFEARLKGLISDITAAAARLDELAELRGALEHEQAGRSKHAARL